MTIGSVVEVKAGQYAGRMDEIGAVTDAGYILKDLPDVTFKEADLIHYETGYLKVGYFPADTHLMAFRQDNPGEKIWAQDGYLYWCALTELEDYFRTLYKHDDREAVPIEELRDKFYAILDENKVDLRKVE